MKRSILIFLLSIICFTSCSKKKEEFLVVGANEMFPPFGYRVGNTFGNEMDGFDIALAKEIAKDMNKTLIISPMKFNDIIPALVKGEIDIALSAMTITDERYKIIDFSTSYYKASQVIIARKGDKRFEKMLTKSDIDRNTTIATERGSTGTKIARQITRAELVSEVNSLDLVLMELISENVDAIIIDRDIARAIANRYDHITILPIEFEIENYGVAIQKGDIEMRDSINKTLERIINSGDYISMVEAYIQGYLTE